MLIKWKLNSAEIPTPWNVRLPLRRIVRFFFFNIGKMFPICCSMNKIIKPDQVRSSSYTFEQKKEDGEDVHRHGFGGVFMRDLWMELWSCSAPASQYFSSSSTVNMAFLNNSTILKEIIGSCQGSVGSVKIQTLLFHSCPPREPSGMLEGMLGKGCREIPPESRS